MPARKTANKFRLSAYSLNETEIKYGAKLLRERFSKSPMAWEDMTTVGQARWLWLSADIFGSFVLIHDEFRGHGI